MEGGNGSGPSTLYDNVDDVTAFVLRGRAMHAVAAAWRQSADEPSFAARLPFLLHDFVKEHDVIRAIYTRTWQAVGNGLYEGREDEVRQRILRYLEGLESDFAAVRAFVPEARRTTTSTEILDQFEAADRSLGEMHTAVAAWPRSGDPLPRLSNALAEKSRAAIARGEYQDAEDLIRALESQLRQSP